MSIEDVQAELDAASAPETPAAPAPEQTNPDPTPDATPKGETPEQPEQPSEDSDSGPFNPDTLPPELVPAWRQLQGDYTRKTQALAEERKQLEALGSVEELQAAQELYTRLSDPENWLQLHEELTEALQEAGMTPAQAHAAATEAVAGGQTSSDELDFGDDPDLAPLAAMIREERQHRSQLQARLDAFEAERQAALMADEAEREQQLHQYNLQRQAAAIRESRPDYQDRDIQAVAKLGSFFNDDLHAAQADLEDYVAYRLNRWLASKADSKSPSIQPQSGAGVDSTRVPDGHETIMDAMQEAEEEIRLLMETGELS